jgi:hypothetical protein
MIKDILRGARNKDTIDELCSRLENTPDTIEGMYEQMLNRLDKLYLREAIKYFRFLMTASSYTDGQCTLLDFVFAEKLAWEHVLSNDLRFFESEKFHKLCDEVETRILTRCAGLVETGEHRDHVLHGVEQCNSWSGDGGAEFIIVGKSQDERSVSRHLREVSFIHKTVIDFLDSRR